MKKILFTTALLILSSFSGLKAQNEPAGTLTYALPQTVINLEVEVVREDFHAGPYAKYAQKYLGVKARLQDEVSYKLLNVVMSSSSEADQSKRYTADIKKDAAFFLDLTAQGLVSVGAGVGETTKWSFANSAEGDFSDKALASSYQSEDATLYKSMRGESQYNKVAVRQEMVVAKSQETLAKETADMIFRLRQARVDIVIGNTDATYSGEAMAAALSEIDKLEKEYMSMFIGYSEYSNQKKNYSVIPKNDNEMQVYVAFRLSDNLGLVAADNLSGKPYLIQIDAQEVEAVHSADQTKAKVAWYRIPAVCEVKLSDGADVLVQSRMPVYQLGVDSSFILNTK